MHIRTLIRAAALLAAATPLSALSALSPNPGTPPGMQGHDWDSLSFSIEGNHIAVVTAVNISTGIDDSSTGFELFVDGTSIDNYTVGGTAATKAYFVRGAGPHNVLIVCHNNVAAQESCRLGAMRADEGVVF